MPKRGGFSRLRRPDWSFRGHMPTFGSTISLGSSALYVMHHSPCRWPNRNRTRPRPPPVVAIGQVPVRHSAPNGCELISPRVGNHLDREPDSSGCDRSRHSMRQQTHFSRSNWLTACDRVTAHNCRFLRRLRDVPKRRDVRQCAPPCRRCASDGVAGMNHSLLMSS